MGEVSLDLLHTMRDKHLSEAYERCEVLKQQLNRYDKSHDPHEFVFMVSSARLTLQDVEHAHNAALYERALDLEKGAMRLDENDRHHDRHEETLHSEPDIFIREDT